MWAALTRIAMNSEIHKDYFIDTQIAAIEGITLGGLRNKIYRLSKPQQGKGKHQEGSLPEFICVAPRKRLWHKEKTRAWLMERYRGDQQIVDRLLQVAEDALKNAKDSD